MAERTGLEPGAGVFGVFVCIYMPLKSTGCEYVGVRGFVRGNQDGNQQYLVRSQAWLLYLSADYENRMG